MEQLEYSFWILVTLIFKLDLRIPNLIYTGGEVIENAQLEIDSSETT